jgi:hypothetical protein
MSRKDSCISPDLSAVHLHVLKLQNQNVTHISFKIKYII